MTTHAGVLAVNHVGVSVSDLAAARHFWVEGLGALDHGGFGWPVGTEPADESLATAGTAAEVQLVRTDAAFMELFAFSSPTPRARAAGTPGVARLVWATDDVPRAAARALTHGGQQQGVDVVLCPDGTPVQLVPRTGADGPSGLVGVEVRVADPSVFPFREVAGPVRLVLTADAVEESGTPVPAAAPVDLGVNHLCLDVVGIDALRREVPNVHWHHPVTESSGGVAAVCYGTTHDGVLVELLESRSEAAFLSRARLATPDRAAAARQSP